MFFLLRCDQHDLVQFLEFFRIQCARHCRYEKRCAALCQKICPLEVFIPRDLSENSHAVCINMIESIMLWKTECQCVHSHTFCTLPNAAACVITRSVQVHQARSKMADGIASDDHCIVAAGSVIHFLIKHFYDLCACFTLVIKMPFFHCIIS